VKQEGSISLLRMSHRLASLSSVDEDILSGDEERILPVNTGNGRLWKAYRIPCLWIFVGGDAQSTRADKKIEGLYSPPVIQQSQYWWTFPRIRLI
jgi:hypothetical protein